MIAGTGAAACRRSTAAAMPRLDRCDGSLGLRWSGCCGLLFCVSGGDSGVRVGARGWCRVGVVGVFDLVVRGVGLGLCSRVGLILDLLWVWRHPIGGCGAVFVWGVRCCRSVVGTVRRRWSDRRGVAESGPDLHGDPAGGGGLALPAPTHLRLPLLPYRVVDLRGLPTSVRAATGPSPGAPLPRCGPGPWRFRR